MGNPSTLRLELPFQTSKHHVLHKLRRGRETEWLSTTHADLDSSAVNFALKHWASFGVELWFCVGQKLLPSRYAFLPNIALQSRNCFLVSAPLLFGEGQVTPMPWIGIDRLKNYRAFCGIEAPSRPIGRFYDSDQNGVEQHDWRHILLCQEDRLDHPMDRLARF